MAWDQICFWKVGVRLFEDHYEIPKYKKSINKYETKKNFKKYRTILANIFNSKEKTHDEKTTEFTR